MYSRNLSKSTVRASPSYVSAKYGDPFSQSRQTNDNSYRYHIPPGYVGSRFSQIPDHSETEPKHHAASQLPERELPIRDPKPSLPAPEPEQNIPKVPACREDVLPEKTEATTPVQTDTDPLGTFIRAIRDRVSGEDLLLIVIILMLAAEGENAEITILLLALLLLIK